MKRYEEIDHTADIAARIYGKDISGLFENAAFCMFDIMGDLFTNEAKIVVDFEAEAESKETLLVKWLNELLFISFEEKLLFSEFDILCIDDNKIKGKASGASYAGKETLLKKEIKAATYHDVEIIETPYGYEVVIVFDV